MVVVYFESGLDAEMVAIFYTEELYEQYIESLEQEAKRLVVILTESIEEEDLFNLYKNFK